VAKPSFFYWLLAAYVKGIPDATSDAYTQYFIGVYSRSFADHAFGLAAYWL
jgi:hypothetical protein